MVEVGVVTTAERRGTFDGGRRGVTAAERRGTFDGGSRECHDGGVSWYF